MAIWHSTTNCAYVSANSFRVTGNLTTQFPATIVVRIYCDGVWKYSSVVSTSYDGIYTTVTIEDSILLSSASSCEVGSVISGEDGTIPSHNHSDDDTGGDDVVGAAPRYEVVGNKIRFKKPNGEWGEWLIGYDGDLGPQGYTGICGGQGDQGAQGYKGHQGVQGDSDGVQGPQGYDGDIGPQGSSIAGEGSGLSAGDVYIHWDYDTYEETGVVLKPIPGTDGVLYVNGELVSCATPKVLVFDSATDYIVYQSSGDARIESTTLSSKTTDYNDGSILYLYLTNSNECWNFSSPVTKDYRNSFVISTQAPASGVSPHEQMGGYMTATGEAANARCVGAVFLNSSREMATPLSLLSTFNSDTPVVTCRAGTGGWTDMSGWYYFTSTSVLQGWITMVEMTIESQWSNSGTIQSTYYVNMNIYSGGNLLDSAKMGRGSYMAEFYAPHGYRIWTPSNYSLSVSSFSCYMSVSGEYGSNNPKYYQANTYYTIKRTPMITGR